MFISSLLIILFIFLKDVQRLYAPDETSYVFNTQLFDSYGILPPFGVKPYISTFIKYIAGRYLWSSYLYAISLFTGVKPYELHLAGILFVGLLASAVTGILHDVFSVSRFKLVFLASIFTILTPAVLPWSITAFLDLPQSYFILVSIYFILKSLKTSQNLINDIDLFRFILGLLYTFITILFKANIQTIALFIIVFTIELYRNRTHLTTTARNVMKILMVLLIIAIAYVLIFDIGSFICHLLGEYHLASILRKYLFSGGVLSASGSIFGMFIELPWERYTIFSYNWKRWLEFVNFALAPEALTILISSTFLALPFITIMNRELRTDTKFRILTITTYTSFWLYFFILMGKNQVIPFFSKYVVHVYVLILTLSIYALHRTFQNKTFLKTSILITIASILLLFINHFVSLEFDGTRFFFGMDRYKYSFFILLLQIGIVTILDKMMKRLKILQRHCVATFLLLCIIFFVVFNNVVLTKSWLYSTNALNDVRKYLEELHLETSIDRQKPHIVISNFHINLRNFLNLEKFIPIPPPATENELKEILRLLPEETIIVLTNNPRISWYEYGNRYIKKYLDQKYVLIEYLGPSKTLGKPQIELLFNESIKIPSGSRLVVNGSFVDTYWGKAVALDGKGNYIAVYNYSLGDVYTIELLFRMNEDPADFGNYPEDVPWVGGKPVTKSLLAKRYHGSEEITISITSRGQVVVCADNENSEPRFEITTAEGIIRKGEWYHLVLVVNNTHARLYINGELVGESSVNGESMVLEEKGIKKEPLYIGADGTSVFKPWRYLRAVIKLLRIHNKALSQEKIMSLYAHIKRVAIIKQDSHVYAIYIKEEPSSRISYVSTTNEVKLVNVAMDSEYTCIVSIDSNSNTTIILATIRFSKIINISRGIQTLLFPLYRSIGTGKRILESTYVCSYHFALDSFGNILWPYIKHGMDSPELLAYHVVLLMLLMSVVNRKFIACTTSIICARLKKLSVLRKKL